MQPAKVLHRAGELPGLGGQWRHAAARFRVAKRQRSPIAGTPVKLENPVLDLPAHLLSIGPRGKIPHQRRPELLCRRAARTQHAEAHRTVGARPIVHANDGLESGVVPIGWYLDDAVRLHVQSGFKAAAIQAHFLEQTAFEREVFFKPALQYGIVRRAGEGSSGAIGANQFCPRPVRDRPFRIRHAGDEQEDVLGVAQRNTDLSAGSPPRMVSLSNGAKPSPLRRRHGSSEASRLSCQVDLMT